MNAYWAILSARFQVLLQYRAAAFAGVVTQLFWGIIRMLIFTAFFHSGRTSQPMTLRETIDYIWLSQAFLLLIPWGHDRDIEDLIRSGQIAYELVRPVDLYWLWYCRSLALRVAPVTLRAIPILLIAVLFFGLDVPASFAAAVAFIFSIIGSMLLSSALTALSSITLFWTISGQGILWIVPTLSFIFSGIIVPLPLFPDWSQPIMNFLPFRGIIDVPLRLYLSHLAPTAAPFLILVQLIWTVILIIFGRGLMRIGLRRVVVQGG
jgi:ABC-2 type transport system permease protein